MRIHVDPDPKNWLNSRIFLNERNTEQLIAPGTGACTLSFLLDKDDP
jgi:hypothetical protein